MQELEHSAKGSTWKNHKYTEILTKNGKKRYIYGSPSSGFRENAGSGNVSGERSTKFNRNAAIRRRTGQGGASSSSELKRLVSSARTVREMSNSVNLKKTASSAAKSYKTKKAVENAMAKVSKKSVSSVTEKAMKTLSTAAKRTRTSADASIKTERGSKITVENVYPNYKKKKRYQ